MSGQCVITLFVDPVAGWVLHYPYIPVSTPGMVARQNRWSVAVRPGEGGCGRRPGGQDGDLNGPGADGFNQEI
jgi:hypothetical protein